MSFRVLQPDPESVRGDHYVPARADQVFWGRLPIGGDTPVLTIDPGESVTFDTLSHEGILEDQGRDPVGYFGRHGVPADQVLVDAVALAASSHPRDPQVDGPHVVTGPVHVRGARPGDLLTMEVVELEQRVPYGVVSNRHGRGALPGEFPLQGESFSVFVRTEDAPGGPVGVLPLRPGSDEAARFPLAPFLGVMGVAAAASERPHSVPPGAFGGNIDVKLLTEGARLHLPVQVEGALAYVGDPHFAQGDGEVALTAVEASLRATIRFTVVPAAEARERYGEVTGPLVETEEFLAPTGLDADLDEAVKHGVRAAIALLEARYGMDRSHALAYLSAATDFDISQVVDRVKGVHAKIRKADFDG